MNNLKRQEQTNPHFLPPFSSPKNTLNRLPVIQDWLRKTAGIVTKIATGESLLWVVESQTEQPVYSIHRETLQEKTYVAFEDIDSELQMFHNLRKVKNDFCNPLVFDVQGIDHPCDTVDSVMQYGRLLARQDLPSGKWQFVCSDNSHRQAGEKEQKHLDNLDLITTALP